jgi:hypothetical protein
MKKLVFRIRTEYFDDIVAGQKTIEYRRDIEYWHKRIKTLGPSLNHDISDLAWFFKVHCNNEVAAVFICGKRKHTRQVRSIERIWTPDWFSGQGQQDVDTPTCLAFNLGEQVG